MKLTCYLKTSVIVAVLHCGCDSTPPEPELNGTVSTNSRSSSLTLGTGLPGYLHSVNASRFYLGSATQEKDEYGYHKFIGESGTFAYDLTNGCVRASQNARSPRLQLRPYGASGMEHNDRVLSYFIAGGIPKEQIRGVQTHPLMGGAGSADVPKMNVGVDATLIAYYSVLSRMTPQGIPILDSQAWARFDEQDQVVSEGVYWPDIPASVVEEASAFKARLSTPEGAAAYKALLPSLPHEGGVVIRHSTSVTRVTFEAMVVLEVTEGAVTRHFGVDGTEKKLPEERLTIPSGDVK
jgi:hypothetical protein